MAFQPLEPGDVISVDNSDKILGLSVTATYEEFVEKLESHIGRSSSSKDWFVQGVPGKRLRAGDQWRSGRVRIAIEFEEDPNPQTEA